jgi:hypothetical protein
LSKRHSRISSSFAGVAEFSPSGQHERPATLALKGFPARSPDAETIAALMNADIEPRQPIIKEHAVDIEGDEFG